MKVCAKTKEFGPIDPPLLRYASVYFVTHLEDMACMDNDIDMGTGTGIGKGICIYLVPCIGTGLGNDIYIHSVPCIRPTLYINDICMYVYVD